jgi:hypothetical protein
MSVFLVLVPRGAGRRGVWVYFCVLALRFGFGLSVCNIVVGLV